MKLTVGDIISAGSYASELFEKEMPISTAWKLSRIMRQLSQYNDDFEENRVRILKKYVGDGDKVPDDKRDDFKEEIEQLLKIEVDLSFEPISIEELGSISTSPTTISALYFLFDQR